MVLSVPNGQLQALEARGDVDAIYLAREYQPELEISTAVIGVKGTGKVWERGITGVGVKVAVIEQGSIYFGHDNLANGIYCNPVFIVENTDANRHASGVAGVIASTHPTYKGVASGVPALLSGNLTSLADAEIMKCTEWALGQGAEVINYSFGDHTHTTNMFTGSDRYVDYIIRNRAVTIVKAAGNIDTETTNGTCFEPNTYVTSPGKGYNVLTVGNYNDLNTLTHSDDVMSPTSCFKNPYSMFGDREKPEIVAPGVRIMTTDCTGPSNCIVPAPGSSGTSFSAPHVTGCAALLMERNQDLKNWPEAIRAILMASAVTNIDGPILFNPTDPTAEGTRVP